MPIWTAERDKAAVSEATAALKSREISTEFVHDRQSALKVVVSKMPEGSEIMAGVSKTLEEICFIDLLKSDSHRWVNLKNEMLSQKSEKDYANQVELARQSTTSKLFLGSVHAVAKTGEVVVASATGLQLASYAFSAGKVI
jgi:hypothetical protein